MNRSLYALMPIFFCAAVLAANDNQRGSSNNTSGPASVQTIRAEGAGETFPERLGTLPAVSNLEPQTESVRPGTDPISRFAAVAGPGAGPQVLMAGASQSHPYGVVSDASSGSRVPVLTRIPVALSPQSRSDQPTQAPQSKRKYWTKRRLVFLAIGLGVAGAGASLWINGKDLPNSNYNPNACRASFNSGPIPFNPDVCNETMWSTSKKTGFWTMIAGGAVSGLSFVPGL